MTRLYVVGLAADLDGGLYLIGVLNAKGLLLAACAVVAGSGLEYAYLYDLCAVCGRGGLGTLSGASVPAGWEEQATAESASTAIRSRAMSFFMIFPPFIFLFVYGIYAICLNHRFLPTARNDRKIIR